MRTVVPRQVIEQEMTVSTYHHPSQSILCRVVVHHGMPVTSQIITMKVIRFRKIQHQISVI